MQMNISEVNNYLHGNNNGIVWDEKLVEEKIPHKMHVFLNDMSVLEENIEQQQEELEIMVEQNNVAEDDILEIKIVIDSLWCPFELGINNDMRN